MQDSSAASCARSPWWPVWSSPDCSAAAAPASAVATPAAAIPQTDCIPVAAHDGSSRAAGCVLASDQYAIPPVYDKLMARSAGCPSTPTPARQQVGILAGPLGFVPQALVGQLPALAACHGQLSEHLASPKVAAISADCTALAERRRLSGEPPDRRHAEHGHGVEPRRHRGELTSSPGAWPSRPRARRARQRGERRRVDWTTRARRCRRSLRSRSAAAGRVPPSSSRPFGAFSC